MILSFVAALASSPSIQMVVGGQPVLVHHGAYCSYPKVAGITTETERPVEVPSWDMVFDPKGLQGDFTGLVLMAGDQPTGAVAMAAQTDLNLPDPNAAFWTGVFDACGLRAMEKAALTELLRKLPASSRVVVVRGLLNSLLSNNPCARAARDGILADAKPCASGRCDALVERVASIQGSSARCD